MKYSAFTMQTEPKGVKGGFPRDRKWFKLQHLEDNHEQ